MSDLHLTPLNDLHQELGGKMVPFAGFSMPVQYASGIVKEHLHTRAEASIFDVSHMGQLILQGENIDAALEKILPISVKGLKAGRQRYGMLTLENGGILDDLMLARIDDHTFYMVINASRKDVDIPHLQKHLAEFTMTELNAHALIAIQGPKAASTLDKHLPGVADMKFMDSTEFNHNGALYRVSRSGYTGEDGYEISIPADQAIDFTKQLLANEAVEMAGLGARDSLRLEAGLCLYGNDIDESTTPVAADLVWAMQKIRRQGGEREAGFVGADIILPEIEQGTAQKRVGFSVEGKLPVRPGTTILNDQGETVGNITSGGFGASIDAPVAMGYVNSELSAIGTELVAQVRKKSIKLTVANMPLVPHRYFRG